MDSLRLRELIRTPLFSEELGIQLRSQRDSEFFKWFLASTLFGARITSTIAIHTYHSFERHRLLSPRRILQAGWEFLVNPVMREGGYVRYDGRKSTQILKDCAELEEKYQGSFRRLHEIARDAQDLEARMIEFYGVGPVTENIFLRELRPFWKKADPETLAIARATARRQKIPLNAFQRKSMAYTRIEAGLLRKILRNRNVIV